MRTWLMALGAAAFGLMATSLASAATLDCPLAAAPYSTQSPLLDLLINPKTKAVLETDGYLQKIPEFFRKETVPSFAAIITLRTYAPKDAASAQTLDALDKALAQVPVTPEDQAVRCARYDDTPPVLPENLSHPVILVFDKINGFRDDPSVDAATAALKRMAARRGWSLVFSDNGAVFNPTDLKRFDAVVWNNVSGDVLTNGQRAAFISYIEHGGGFAGVHGSGGDPAYFWDWYVDTLIGARFNGHPMAPQFQDAHVVVDDPASAIVAPLAPGWHMTEEWYSFKSDPRASGSHILLTLDETTYIVPDHLKMGDHPIAWTRCIGDGRSFYTALGHMPANYSEPHTESVIENGIAWAAGQGATQCADGKEQAKP